MTPRRGLVAIVFAIVAATPGLAFAQRLGAGAEFEPPLLRLALGLLLCTIVAIVAAIALKRFMHGGRSLKSLALLARAPQRRIRVLETHRISPGADVCMFTCDEREYLVVVSAGGAALIADKEAPQDPSP